MDDAQLFLQHIGKYYEQLKKKYKTFAQLNDYKWDEDVFQDTIVKCHDTIQKQGYLKDSTPKGIEGYFFLSLRNNLKREGQYSRNKKRVDKEDDDIMRDLEDYLTGESSVQDKIKNDFYKDFTVLYLMQKADENFDTEHFHAFSTKMLCGLTYSQLKEQTHIKGVRTKVLEVKNFLKENVSKEEIKEAFDEIYGKLFD